MGARVKILFLIFFAAFLATMGRLFFLQIIQGEHYQNAAEKQQTIKEPVESKRGTIFFQSLSSGDKKYVPAAVTKRSWNIWVSPKDIKPEEKEEAISALAGALSVKEEVIRERVNKENDPYEPLEDQVSEEVKDKVKDLGISAVGWQEVDDRYYPLGELAAQTIGFVSKKENKKIGQYGLEEFYEKTLSGDSGLVSGFINPFGLLIWPFTNIADASDGADIYLTIDYNIQLLLEKELKKARENFSAKSASGIIVEPKTGKIIAMASVPSFNPNSYEETESVSLFLNPNTQTLFEPGSVFKPITMAAGLDINIISPDLTYEDKGFVKVGDVTIKNSTNEVHGVQTMTQVLEKSLNTGVIFVVRKIPQGVWRDYIEAFGISKKTGIDLVGEVKGDISNIKSGNEVEIATSAFGQGIATTPISLAMAISTIANGGEAVSPYLVEKIVSDDGEAIEETEPKDARKVIRKETAETVTKMMVSVVENGFGQRAQIDGYSVAGKTGTAQVPSPQGGYSKETIHSFVGFAPAFNPAFVMLVKIDNPQGGYFSDRTAAPVFHDVGEFILHYYGIDPDRPLVE